MAEGGDHIPVNCGVTPGPKPALNYKLGKNVDKKSITWDWEMEEGGMVANLRATTSSGDIRYHKSAPVDANTVEQLGKPSKSLDGEFYKVKFKKSSDVPDLQKYFDVPQ